MGGPCGYEALPGVGLVEVYPVGVLQCLHVVRGAITAKGLTLAQRRGSIQHEWRREVGYLRRQIAARNWRAVRNSFNGYLAEPYEFPPGLHRCGRGWTQRAAVRSLLRLYRESRVEDGAS